MSNTQNLIYRACFTFARLMTGIILIRVGWEMFSTEAMTGYIQWLTDIKFPFPKPMAYLGKLAELAGGLALVVGLFTRILCVPVIIAMFVITFIMGDGNISGNSFLLLLLALVFIGTGAGPWSLDEKIMEKKGRDRVTNSGFKSLMLVLTVLCHQIKAQPAETWITKPFAQWPQIALVNEFNFKDGSRPEDTSVSYVGSAFLIRYEEEIFAVTVKHTLFVAWRKLDNKVSLADKLDRWMMYPKNERNNCFKVGPLVNEDPEEKIQDGYQNGVLQRDWLVFKVDALHPGIYPLSIRSTPVVQHEKVYVMGNPYRFDQSLGLRGIVVKQEGNLFLIDLEVPDSVFLGGASGSPIMDRNGQLIGIFSNTRMDPVSGKKSYLINSTNYLLDILRGKKPLNKNLVPVSTIVDSLVVNVSVSRALSELKQLYADPGSYFQVNLSWPDYPALQLTGEKLLDKLQFPEAIRYYKGLLEKYPGNHFFILSLAKAFQLSGEILEAKQVLSEALKHAEPFTKEEYQKMLKEIEKC